MLQSFGKSHILAEDGVVTADRWSIFLVLLARLAQLREILVAAKDRASEPDGISLHDVLEDIACHCVITSRLCVEDGHSVVENLLSLSLQAGIEALE